MDTQKLLYTIATEQRNIIFDMDKNANPVFNVKNLITAIFEMATKEERKIMFQSLVKYEDPELFKKLLEE